MSKLTLIVKSILTLVFGLLATYSFMMFPFLVGSSDANISLIGFSYLGVFLASATIIYMTFRKEFAFKKV